MHAKNLSKLSVHAKNLSVKIIHIAAMISFIASGNILYGL